MNANASAEGPLLVIKDVAGLQEPAGQNLHVTLAEATALDDGVQVVYRLSYEVEGQSKPCCVADLVFRYHS